MRNGFTLTELLIALAVLGVIVAFVIPKVVQAQQDDRKKAVFKETIAMLAEINYRGWTTKELNDCNFRDYFFERVNAVKLCNVSSTGGGCWPQPYFGFQPMQAGFVLANGATVAGFDQGGTCTLSNDAPIIDWNGAAGPNQEGDDQMELDLNYRTVTDTWGTRPGGIGTVSNSLSRTLYQQIYN